MKDFLFFEMFEKYYLKHLDLILYLLDLENRFLYKLNDNFRLYCNSTVPTAINAISTNTVDDTPAYNLMGIRVNPATVRGIYIHNGKKYMK